MLIQSNTVWKKNVKVIYCIYFFFYLYCLLYQNSILNNKNVYNFSYNFIDQKIYLYNIKKLGAK